MVHVVDVEKTIWTAADLAERFGAIPLNRVRTDPPPGLGTEQDVVDLDAHEDRLYELIDGVLLEKTMGAFESYLGGLLLRRIGDFAEDHHLGVVLGADGMLRLFPGRLRIPDVSFVSSEHEPIEEMRRQAIPDLFPDLAVEVISPSNTPREMTEKLNDYFQSGTRLVWYVYPLRREVEVYRNATDCVTLTSKQTLTGGEVLPGFELELKELFAESGPAEAAGK